MKNVIMLILVLLFLDVHVKAQEQTWKNIPYYLKEYETEYEKSPKEAALAWFQDARFGLFIHWGPAALYEKGEWVMYNKRIPFDEYIQTVKKFKGEKFDAKAYVDLAVKAKMKYITFVAKHHEGYERRTEFVESLCFDEC